MEREVVSFVGMNLASIKHGWGIPLRFYYLLHLIDMGGSGKLEFADTVDAISELLHQSKQNVRTILRKRGGIFWHVFDKRIYPHASTKIAAELGLESPGERVLLSENDLTISLTHFKAKATYSLMAKASNRESRTNGKIISRAAITEASGLSKATQRRYERAIKVRKTWTYGYCKITKDNWDKLPFRDGGIHEQRGQFIKDIDHDGVNELVWQCPNSYAVDMDYIGGTRRTRSHHTSLPANRPKRLYYDDIQSASKAEQGGVYAVRRVQDRYLVMKFIPNKGKYL